MLCSQSYKTVVQEQNSWLILEAKKKILSWTYLAEVVGHDSAAEGAQFLRHGADVGEDAALRQRAAVAH